MRSGGLRVIAAKEFRDHIRSRRFHILLGIFLIIAVVGLIDGSIQYNKQIDDYNDRLAQVSDDEIMPSYFGWKPSILSAFFKMSMLITTVGVVLGCAMGFDLISREKESKSLKILLSHPIYRDEVINGKALGGIAAIALAMGIVLVLSFAIILIFGIVPNLDESVRILLFGGLSFLLIFSYFAIALFMSTVAKDSSNALIYTLIIFIVLSTLIPAIAANESVMNAVIGEPPEPPHIHGPYLSSYAVSSSSTASSTGEVGEPSEVDLAWEEYREKSDAYWEKRRAFTDAVNLLSPSHSYQQMAMAVTEPRISIAVQNAGSYSPDIYEDLPESGLAILGGLMGALAKNVIALLVIPAAFFGLAWVRFMREDIR
ncbi:ABC-2 type transport system permease protein [Methanofollis sp. W23]|uniref:ABC transporter permease n=1 Tax=Methanofollis sp. W23 TaxID=2817849 RepID=UPI001AE982B6|nr:ABC transporter permease subunit [Methanofollis sp. W23]MBP2146700.1 ABC-2 type transport system permease protein [Methanofollis sp. W23]